VSPWASSGIVISGGWWRGDPLHLGWSGHHHRRPPDGTETHTAPLGDGNLTAAVCVLCLCLWIGAVLLLQCNWKAPANHIDYDALLYLAHARARRDYTVKHPSGVILLHNFLKHRFELPSSITAKRQAFWWRCNVRSGVTPEPTCTR
jgi:hypothetical protein